jgi:hypothetical protein
MLENRILISNMKHLDISLDIPHRSTRVGYRVFHTTSGDFVLARKNKISTHGIEKHEFSIGKGNQL